MGSKEEEEKEEETEGRRGGGRGGGGEQKFGWQKVDENVYPSDTNNTELRLTGFFSSKVAHTPIAIISHNTVEV